jgi:hypothetical protein
LYLFDLLVIMIPLWASIMMANGRENRLATYRYATCRLVQSLSARCSRVVVGVSTLRHDLTMRSLAC